MLSYLSPTSYKYIFFATQNRFFLAQESDLGDSYGKRERYIQLCSDDVTVVYPPFSISHEHCTLLSASHTSTRVFLHQVDFPKLQVVIL